MTSKIYSLPKKFLADWIAALENPANKKCTRLLVLYDGDTLCGTCATGLACVVAGVDPHKLVGISTIFRSKYPALFSPVPSGLSLINFAIGDSLQSRIFDLNDRQEFTFPQIAQWLRENVEPEGGE